MISINDCDEKGVNYCNPSQFPDKSIARFIGSVDEDLDYYHWNHEIENKSIIKNLKNDYDRHAKKIVNIIALKTGKSDRIYNLEVVYVDKEKNNEKSHIIESEYKIRVSFVKFFSYSALRLLLKKEEQGFNLNGKGWGHGVGLCQIGALGMALRGKIQIKYLVIIIQEQK